MKNKKITVEDIKIETEKFSLSPKEYTKMQDHWYNENVRMYKTYSNDPEKVQLVLAFFSKNQDDPLSMRFIKYIECELEKKTIGSHVVAADYVKEKLKHYYPEGPQIDLFDSLENDTKNQIIEHGLKKEEVVEGIKLDPAEDKLMGCLCKELHEKSQINNPEKPDYYAGNARVEAIAYGENKDQKPKPQILITLHELTKEYDINSNKPGGNNMKVIEKLLYKLSQKHFLFKYTEHYTRGKIKTTNKIEYFRPLIELFNFEQKQTDLDENLLKQNQTILIKLHPIFNRYIDTKFIINPNDINKRMQIAYGYSKISKAAIQLKDYFLLLKRAKVHTHEIGVKKLYYKLAEGYMKQNRHSKVKALTDKAITTMLNLGLLESFEVIDSKTLDSKKIIFKINLKWT